MADKPIEKRIGVAEIFIERLRGKRLLPGAPLGKAFRGHVAEVAPAAFGRKPGQPVLGMAEVRLAPASRGKIGNEVRDKPGERPVLRIALRLGAD